MRWFLKISSFHFVVTQHMFDDKFYFLRFKTMLFNTLKDLHTMNQKHRYAVTPKGHKATQPAKPDVSLISIFILKTMSVAQVAEIKTGLCTGKEGLIFKAQ